MKNIVIYHRADYDGIFCREIAKKFMPDAQLIGWDYGDPEPQVDKGVQLYILDLSVPSLMDHPNLTWIDHHKTAIDKYPESIDGWRIDGVAACRLAWQWFLRDPQENAPAKQDFIDRKVSEPWAVRLAGEFDIWDKRDPDAELFQCGLRSRELSALDWREMLGLDRKASVSEVEALIDVGHRGILKPDGTVHNPIVVGLLESGKVVQYVKTTENKSIIEAYGHTVTFEGLTFLACNHARFNSLLFTAGIKPEHDALMGYNYDGKNGHWRVSLYHAPGKEHHDLSEIAKRYGGGGHRGACGFTQSTPPVTEGK